MLRLEQQQLVATWAEFQHSMVYFVRLISVEKDWKQVLMQKMVTLNTCCDIACLTFQLPDVTTGFFTATDDNPQLDIFRASSV